MTKGVHMAPGQHRPLESTPKPRTKSARGAVAADSAVGVSDRPARHLRGAITRYRSILEQCPDATVVADQKGRMLFINRQTEALFGYTRKELLGQPVEQLIPARFHGAHRQHRTGYAAEPRTQSMGANLQVFGRHRDGSEFPVEVRLSALEAAGELLVIASVRDVSELQRITAAHTATDAANVELQHLQTVTDTALSHLALDDLLRELLGRVTGALGVDDVAILLLEADGQQLTMRASRGLEDAVAARAAIPVGQGFAGRIAATRAPLIADDLSAFEVFYPQMRKTQQSAIGVPLLVEDRLLGVVYVGSAVPRRFTERDVQLLQRVADRVALAIDRARLFEAEQAARREAEATLARAQVSERRFQRLMDAGIIGIVVGDTEQVIEANDAYLQMLGYTRADLLAGRLSRVSLTPPEYFSVAERAMQEALTIGASALYEKEYIRQDGSRMPAVAGMALLERDPVRFVSFVLDLTEHKRLKREREAARVEAERQANQLDHIFEGIADGLVVYDAQGRIVRTNAAARRILGLDAAPLDYSQMPALDRASLYEVRDEQDRPLAPDEWPIMRVLGGKVGTRPDARDVRMRTLDGREIEVTFSTAPLRDREGHLMGAVSVLHDMTERRRLEREREDARIREEAARDANQRMERFLAIASHDLRIPVTAALGSVQLTQRRARLLATPPAPAPKGAAAGNPYVGLLGTLESANQALHRLSRLIGRLFDLASARTDQLELMLAPHNLTALVRASVAAQRAASSDRTIRLHAPADQPVLVVADADRLDQVVTNYVTNALKYSPAHRPVEVRLAVEDGVLARVSVHDQGPGVPPEERERVWQLFHRVPGMTVQSGREGSLGLGLYLCKTLVERHGGQVGLDSAPGQGATFWFTLPLARASANA